MPERRLATIFALIGVAFTLVVYLPDVGHGLLKDDFAWIASAERLQGQPLGAFTIDSAGNFFRPAVTLSFLADYALHGLRARGYGVTNLALVLLCALSVVVLARGVGQTLAASTAAGTIWLMNPHAINMSLLWISGRTSLLMALFSTAAIAAAVRRHVWLMAVLLFAALLSKEDAVLVPAIVLVAMWLTGAGRRDIAPAAAAGVVAVIAYFALRVASHAMTTTTAPEFYRLTWDPAALAANAAAYLDRSATFAAALLLLLMLAVRAMPSVDRRTRRVLLLALVWFLCGIAITVRVPVRSSLYALFPSIAGALTFAAVVDGVRTKAPRAVPTLAVLLILPVVAFPFYRSRNARWVLPADVSAHTVQVLESETLPDAGLVTFEDDAVRFANFSDALGTGATDALRLSTRKALDAAIVPKNDRTTAATEVARFRLSAGEVRRVR